MSSFAIVMFAVSGLGGVCLSRQVITLMNLSLKVSLKGFTHEKTRQAKSYLLSTCYVLCELLVPRARIELALPKKPDFESGASTSSATPATSRAL